MSTGAYIGSQTLLELNTGASPPTWTVIGEVVNIGPLAQKKDLIEVTHMQSTAKEFIGGLSDGQEITVVCNFLPTDAPQVALLAAAATTSAAKDFRYTLPPAKGSLHSLFSALVLSSSIGPTLPNGAVQVTFGFKVTGPITAFA